MTPDRAYKLPSTIDERKRLVGELVDMCTAVLGEATRANIERWTAYDMPELRRVHGNWAALMQRRAQQPSQQQVVIHTAAPIEAQRGLF